MFLFASIAAPGRCSPSSLFVIFVLVVVTFFFYTKEVQTQFSPRSALSKEFVCNYGIASNIANQQIDVWSVKNLLYLQLNRLVRSAPNGQLSAKLDNPFINNNNIDDDNADGDGNYDVDGNAVWERHLAIYNTRFKRFVKHIAFNETSPILAIYDHTRPVHLNDSIPITDVIESYLIRSDLTNVVINPLSVLYFESRSSLRHYCHNDWFYDEQSSRFCRRHPVVTDLDRVLAFGSQVTVDNVNTVHYAMFRSTLLRANSVEECSVRSVSRISAGQVRDTLKQYVSASVLSLQAGQQTISARNSRQNIRYMFSNKLGLFISWFVTPTTSYEYLENDEWFLMENCAVLMAVKLLPSIKICSKQGRFVSFFEVESSIYALMSDHHRVIELTHDYLKKQYRLHNNFNIDVDQLKSDQFFNKFFGCVYNPYQAITTPTTTSQPETVGHGHRSGPRPTRRPHPQRHHGHLHSSVSSRNESSVEGNETSLKSTTPSPVNNNAVHKVAKRSIFDYSNLDQQLKQVAEADLPRSYNYDGSPFMIQERGAFAGAGSEHSSSWWYLVIVIVFIILCCLAFLIMCCVYKKEKPLEEDDESKRRMVSGNEKVAGTFGLPILRQGHFKPSGKYGSLLFDKGSSPLLGKRTPSRLSHVNKIRDLNYKRGGAGAVAHAISLHDDTVTFTNKTTKVTKTTMATVTQDDDEIVKFVGKIPADLLRKEDKILQSLKHRKSNTSNRSNRSIKSNCSAGVPHQGSNASNRSNKSNQSTKTNASIKSNVSQKGSNSSTQTNATIKIISAKTTNAVLKAKSARSTKTRGSVKTRGSIKSGHYSIKSSKPTTLATHNASKTGSLKSAKPMAAQMQPLLSQPSTTTTVSTKSSKPMALPLPPLLPSASKTGSVKSSKPKPMPMGTFRHLSKATMFSRKHHASKTGSMKSAKPGVLPGPPPKVSADLPAPASQQHSSTVDSSVVSSSVNQSSAPGSQQQSSAADSSMSSSAASSTGPAPLSHQSSAAESTMSSNMSSSSSAPPSQASHTSGSTNKSTRPMALPQPSHTSGSTNKSIRPMALPHPSHTGGSKTKSARPMALPQPSQTSGSSTKSTRPMALQLPSHTSGATTRTRPVALPMPASVCAGPKEKSSSSNATLQTRKTMAQMNKQMASKRLSKYGKSMSKRAPSAHRSNVLPSAAQPPPPPPPQTITTTIITTTIIKKPIENQGSQTSGESSSAASSSASSSSN